MGPEGFPQNVFTCGMHVPLCLRWSLPTRSFLFTSCPYSVLWSWPQVFGKHCKTSHTAALAFLHALIHEDSLSFSHTIYKKKKKLKKRIHTGHSCSVSHPRKKFSRAHTHTVNLTQIKVLLGHVTGVAMSQPGPPLFSSSGMCEGTCKRFQAPPWREDLKKVKTRGCMCF